MNRLTYGGVFAVSVLLLGAGVLFLCAALSVPARWPLALVLLVLGGGDVPENSWVDEDYILALERKAFVELCAEKKTQDRLEHMLTRGKPLRN